MPGKRGRGRKKNQEPEEEPEDEDDSKVDEELRTKKKGKVENQEPIEEIAFVEGANDLVHLSDKILQDELIKRGFIPEFIQSLEHWQLVFELRKLTKAQCQTDSKHLKPQPSVFNPLIEEEDTNEEEEEENNENKKDTNAENESFDPNEFKELSPDDELPNGFIKKYNDMLLRQAVPQEVIDSLPDHDKKAIQVSLKSNSSSISRLIIKYVIPFLEANDPRIHHV